MAQWERHNEIKNPTPVESAKSSYESLPYGSNHNSPFGSSTSGIEPGNKHSVIQESDDKFNLQVQTNDTSRHFLSGE